MRKAFLSLMLFLGLTGVLGKGAVLAQTDYSLTAFPAVQDVLVTAGKQTRTQIQFKNNSESPISGTVKAANYFISNDDGTPILIEKEQTPPKYGAANWLEPAPAQITIPAKDFVTVDIFVNVPSEIATCGNYALVYFQPDSVNLAKTEAVRESSSAIITKIGALVNFTTENKKCNENALVNYTGKNRFFEYGPVKAEFKISNQSDLHINPNGVITLTNWLGQTVDQQKITDKRIFPETAKNYLSEIGHRFMIGKYKVIISAGYGSQGRKLDVTQTVWVFPWRMALAVILSIIILGLLLRNMIGGLQKKEARLEKEIAEEKSEIEKLKQALKKRGE